MRDYLKSITDVCPFSLEYFDQGQLPILKYSLPLIDKLYNELHKYPAILFKCHSTISRKSLESKAHELSDTYPDAEWFWSHPKDGHKSTVVPVLIMQNKETLSKARKEFKLIYNEKD
jgi:hypothetical protein|tara:strand:+ start:120 stop:470 length:351 start_codon:yes stop_codon:yes gene_type:complete